MKTKLNRFFVMVLVLTLVSLACGKGSKTNEPTSPPPLPTATQKPVAAQPTATTVPPTATAVPPTPIPVPPTATPKPALEVASGWYMFTNGNYVRGIGVLNGTLWAATGGGVVSWDLATGKVLKKYTTLDGLPTNDITSVVVCPIPENRVIFGSEGGLSVYDPTADQWEQMTPDNSKMKSQDVASLDCDTQAKTLMIGYTFGLDIYNTGKGEWKYWDKEGGLATDWVSHVTVIGKETWVVSSFGVSAIQADGKVTAYTEQAGNIPDENVEAVAGDAQGNVWLAAFDGLMKFSKGKFTIYNSDNVEKFPFLEAFNGVVVASDGMVWAGNAFGSICQFDPAKGECVNIYEDQDGMVGGLNQMIIDEQGKIYYCDDGGGISIFDGTQWTKLALEEKPLSNNYNAVTQSPDGTIWVGTDKGLQQFSALKKDPQWETVDLDGNSVYSFLPTPEGMWVGHGGGASFYNYASKAWTHLATGDPGKGVSGYVSAIAMDGKGRQWFGTSSGLTVWDGKIYTYYDLLTDKEKTDGWSPKFVYSAIYDGENVWIGTSGALFRFDKTDQMTRWDQQLNDLFGFWSPTIYAFALDQGELLVAINNKLLRYENDKFSEVYQAESDITSIFITFNGNIWLGLYSTGVAYFDGSHWKNLTTADGLPSSHFDRYGVLVDYVGTVWFASAYGGIARRVP